MNGWYDPKGISCYKDWLDSVNSYFCGSIIIGYDTGIISLDFYIIEGNWDKQSLSRF